jgi:hypothetical protein
MPIEFRCPICTKRLRVPDGTEGGLAQCPLCGMQTRIPGAPPAGVSMPSWEPAARCPASGYPDAPDATDQEGDGSEPFRAESFSSVETECPPASGPAAFGPSAWNGDWNRPYAYARIRTPASWLVALSAMGFGLGLVSLLLVVLGMQAEGHRVAPQDHRPMELQQSVVLVMMGLGLLMDLMVLWGSSRMKQLENYPLAMTAALLAIVPCTSPCCVVSIPFGIWALVELTDPRVKAAFR